MRDLWASKNHHRLLQHQGSARLCWLSAITAASPTGLSQPDSLLPDLDKFWTPLASGQGPCTSQLSSSNLSRAQCELPPLPGRPQCPGCEGHAAEAGAGLWLCPRSAAG